MTSPEALAATHARAFARQGRGWRPDEIAGLLDQPHVLLIGNATAFALVQVVAGEAELLTIATDPDHRRKGRARDVLTDALQKAAGCGAARMFLEVAADNAAALALYADAGFRETGRRAGYYARDTGSVDAVTMALDLP